MEVDMRLIYKIAWKFNRDDLDFDDLVGEASFAYARAMHDFDPKRPAKFSTYCWTQMRNHLLNYLKCRRSQVGIGDYKTQLKINEITQEDRYFFLEEIYSLGPKVKEICEMIFEDPKAFMGQSQTESRVKIWTRLREKGWNWKTIKESYRQLNSAMNAR